MPLQDGDDDVFVLTIGDENGRLHIHYAIQYFGNDYNEPGRVDHRIYNHAADSDVLSAGAPSQYGFPLIPSIIEKPDTSLVICPFYTFTYAEDICAELCD